MDHGVLQAAVVVAAGQLTSDETNPPEWQYWSQMWSQAKDRLVSEEFNLRNIGIWYDFSCMPQDAVLLASREPAGNAELQENLSILHELVACCPVIALRTENDSYKQRGWWAAGTFYR